MNSKNLLLCRGISAVAVVLVLLLTPAISYSQLEDYSIEHAAHIGGQTQCAVVQGNYAYLAQGDYLTILEINGTEFRQISTLLLQGQGIDFAISGNYLYCYVNSDTCFQVIDVSDPLNPVIAANMTGLPTSKGFIVRAGLFLTGDYVYAATGTEGLKIIDISNPFNPLVVGSYKAITEFKDVAVSGNYAFVVDGNMERVHVIDVSVPSNPIKKTDTYVPRPEDIAVQGNYAYFAVSKPSFGLQILNITNPLNPTLA
ncbi:MAG TPA: hypothetical protein ENN22_09665 [bacterium]|nr:hypothetical protein [bacterium]